MLPYSLQKPIFLLFQDLQHYCGSMRKGGKILLKKRIDRSRMSIQHQRKENDVKKDWEAFSVKQQKNAGSAMQLNVSDYKYINM